MWNTEKFDAVSGRRQAIVLRPPIFLNPTCHSVSDERFISSDFGPGPRPFCVRLRRKCGKLNRQTPIYRNHSKSQKTNNRDLLKSPKIQILQDHKARACGLILTLGNEQFSPFLTGSALQTEIAVTRSKQSIGAFLTGSRIASPPFTHRASSAAGTLTFLSDRRPIRYNVSGPNFSREARNLS
jgi:hypothetical protein